MKIFFVTSVLFVMAATELNCGDSYRILGFFPLNVRSHFNMYEALAKGLARKGHQVDIISPFPQKKPFPNYTDIIVVEPDLSRVLGDLTYDKITKFSTWITASVSEFCGNQACMVLRNSKIVEFIKNPPRDRLYDLVIVPFLAAHCCFAMGYHLGVPTIGVSASTLYPWLNGMVANPANLAFAPNILLDYVAPLTFLQRLWNTVHTIFDNLHFQYITRVQDDLIKQYFGEDTPSVRELERNVSLVLANSHPALNGPAPITTAVVEVAGLHISDEGPELPHDLIKWMDESEAGFVYFSFGSLVKLESFPVELIRAVYKSLAKIAPMRVLIRIPDPDKLPPGVPENVRTFVWITQYKVLKHKHIKAFITHGGLLGTLEAVHCAVPMIGVPMFADQFTNLNLYVSKKMAVMLDYNDITEETMDRALNAVLYNPDYKNSMLNISAKFLDRPMSPMDTATWWVEYVIKHGGSGLRSPAMDLTWWEIELLDVYAFILLIAVFIILLIRAIIRFLIAKLFITRDTKKIDSKKNN